MDIEPRQIWIRWLWIVLRIVLGGIFIYASIDKIINPEQFIHALANYRILPRGLENFFALLLPWVEVTIGVFLVLGMYEWIALTLYNILMLVFMAVIALSLIRGLNISCGCFTTDPNAAKITWLTMMRDSLILVLSLGGYPLLSRLKPLPFLKKKSTTIG